MQPKLICMLLQQSIIPAIPKMMDPTPFKVTIGGTPKQRSGPAKAVIVGISSIISNKQVAIEVS